MPAKCLLACLALAAGLGFPRLVAASPSAQAAAPSLAATMLSLINSDRHAAGLAPLHAGRHLARLALAHSIDMADHGYFSHITPRGASPYDRMAQAGIHFRAAGENIGVDVAPSQVEELQRIEVAMLHSPEHRANLLRPTFTRVGIGIAIIGDRLYLTEDFKN
ncbi:MAG TPA: CAP domain-containing protein [Chloroflexota bacterium]